MHALSDSAWPVLDDLLSRVTSARRRVAAAQALEATLLAEAIDVVAARTELRRQEAVAAGRSFLSDADLPLREVSLELGMVMRVSDRTVQSRLSDAYTLTTRFPRTHRAWAAGDIDAAHAWAIVRAGSALTEDGDRERFEELSLEVAATESPARMAHAARAIAATLRPDLFAERARAAVDERSVRLYDLDEGMARIIADLPAPLAYAILDALTALARAEVDAQPAADPPAASEGAHATEGMRADDDATTPAPAEPGASGPESEPASASAPAPAPVSEPASASEPASKSAQPTTQRVLTGPARRRGETARDHGTARAAEDRRTIDQRRADLLCDLLLTGTPTATGIDGALAGITARIQVTVPALTLAGDADGPPALLGGYGPIDGELARRLAGLAPGWDRVFTDPRTGAPLDVDRYRPSAHLSRYLAARDERCRTPGCGQLIHRCDRDHTIAAAVGGATTAENLAHFCRRHHICKHHTAWRVRQLGGGTLEWTGPSGRRYIDRPPAVVRFVPAAEDPPPF